MSLRDHLAPGAMAPKALIERVIRNLRISITDRCNFRCIYCMPKNPIWMPRGDLLSFEEIVRLARIFVGLGIEKIRITGGEPTVRKDCPRIIMMLGQIQGLREVTLTTNGYLLSKLARELYDAGLRRINISLDTLDPQKFKKITRTDLFYDVLKGLDAALAAGFAPIKINMVVIRGYNDDEIVSFAEFGRKEGHFVRFIEFMPLDADNIWDKSKVATKQEIIKVLSEKFEFGLVTSGDPTNPASTYCYKDVNAEFGVISSVSDPFCTRCNRIRLTADGRLRVCLFAQVETDLRSLLRSGQSDQQIKQIIIDATNQKGLGHLVNTDEFIKPSRSMGSIGG